MVDGYEIEAFEGPNLVRVSENFYADQTEVSNLFYKEYLYWLESVFGTESAEYIRAFPDSTVWTYQKEIEIDFDTYFWSYIFDDYPVVGITLEQAKNYSSWRTDRVLELTLIDFGYLPLDLKENRKNYFSVERLINGEVELLRELKDLLVYTIYEVPTIEQWDELSGLISDSEKEKANSYSSRIYKQLRPYDDGRKNKFGIYNVVGNVAELVDSPGVTKGGSWKHHPDDTPPLENFKQNIPNCWTGFRTVGRLAVY